jgi:glycosyltransferase involved in cell wall biosynthesis/peptidoglycan/xylan/chitin deacetylase (PgdA/CDA1 family)
MKDRILVVCQAMDSADPLNGFFHRWMEVFSSCVSHVSVLALRVGRYDLPANVVVQSLRPTDSRSRLRAIWTLLRESWRRRDEYDAVFVRQDWQYVCIAGLLWRLMGKRIVLWYTHYTAKGFGFWCATRLANEVVTAVPESNPSAKAIRIGHHIDTDAFALKHQSDGGPLRVLVFGRVSPVKRVPWIVAQLDEFIRASRIHLRIVGRATEDVAHEELRLAVSDVSLWEDRDVLASEAPSLYRWADVVVNATPGSMDKVILEAAASGCLILAATKGILHGLPDDLHWLYSPDSLALQGAMHRILSLTAEERQQIGERLRTWVLHMHAMPQNIQATVALLCEQSTRPAWRQRLHRCAWLISKKDPHQTPVLMFHAMDGRGSSAWDRYRLTALFTRLRSQGFESRQVSDVPRPHSYIVTIDDATEDLLSVVDLFRRFGVTATVFAPSEVGTVKTTEGYERRVLTASELATLVSQGVIDVGGHGKTHTPLPSLELNTAREEIMVSLKYVSSFSADSSRSFAYPKGKFTNRDVDLVREAGFTRAFTVQPGYWMPTSDLYRIPRIPLLQWMNSRDVTRLIRGVWRI